MITPKNRKLTPPDGLKPPNNRKRHIKQHKPRHARTMAVGEITQKWVKLWVNQTKRLNIFRYNFDGTITDGNRINDRPRLCVPYDKQPLQTVSKFHAKFRDNTGGEAKLSQLRPRCFVNHNHRSKHRS